MDDTSNVDPVIDEVRTTRSHAGEGVKDAANWPGFVLIGIGVISLALTLMAVAYGLGALIPIAGAVCVASLAAGIAVVLLEHRRIKHREGLSLSDPQGH